MTSEQACVKSFAVTVRPRAGISDDEIKTFVSWTKKKCDYYYVITHKDHGDRHIHAGLFFKKSCTRSNLATQLLRLFKDMDVEEKQVLRKGIKMMYNNDFIDNYMSLDKVEENPMVVVKSLPEQGTIDSYYSLCPAPKKKGPSATDPFYANLEKLWFEFKRPIEETNPPNLRNFLMNMMNNERKIRVIADNKKIFMISVALSRYINKEESFHVEADQFHQDV